MLVYWKKYEKVEKEHRKRAEKEAMEQRKLDDEFREVTTIDTHFFSLILFVCCFPVVSVYVHLSNGGVFV